MSRRAAAGWQAVVPVALMMAMAVLAEATILVPAELTELVRDAGAIVRARVVATEPRWESGSRRIETLVTFDADEYYKGDLGRRFVSNAGDFAYPPEGLTIDRISDIRRMRERIERERVKPPDAAKFHFKLGYGSLSDVQFAVEVSLMRHGGAHPDLRTPRTLDAIERLAEQRLLEGSVARDLGEAFVFLSEVKNALEIDRRLHAEAVPPQPADQDSLARRLGYQEYPRQSFLDDYLRITRRCRRAMDRVFADPE